MFLRKKFIEHFCKIFLYIKYFCSSMHNSSIIKADGKTVRCLPSASDKILKIFVHWSFLNLGFFFPFNLLFGLVSIIDWRKLKFVAASFAFFHAPYFFKSFFYFFLLCAFGSPGDVNCSAYFGPCLGILG
jgi:hypothetical protein